MKIVTTKGDGKILNKHENVASVSKTNNISSKWLYFADGAEIPQYSVYKHHTVVLCYHKDSIFNPMRRPLYVRATYRKVNVVKFYDMSYNFEGSYGQYKLLFADLREYF